MLQSVKQEIVKILREELLFFVNLLLNRTSWVSPIA